MGARRQREPRFLWTGLLILGPVLALGAVGFLQLRQDRASAMVEARTQAVEAARWIGGNDSPVHRLVDGRRWQSRVRPEADGAPRDGFTYADPPAPAAQVGEDAADLASLLDDREAAPAMQLQQALAIVERARGVTAAGLPVQPLASRHALRMAIAAGEPHNRIEALAERLANRAVFHPSVLSEALLDVAAEVLGDEHPEMLVQRERWRSDQWTRELLKQFGSEIRALWERARSAEPAPGAGATARRRAFFAMLDADPPLLCRLRGQGKFDLATIPADGIQEYVLEDPILANVAPHFGFRLWVDGHQFVNHRAAADAEVLAVHVDPGLATRAEVVLADPAALFAPVAERTRQTALLITLAALAAAIGWLAAWRAFVVQGRLAAMKDNFVSAVSHELKAPVAAIGLMAEEIESGAAAGTEKRKEYAQLIAGECARLGSLIENVLDYARIESGRDGFEFEEADIGELVRAAGDLMRPAAAARGMQIDVDAPPAAELSTAADARALGRVLVNLLDNAIKYAPAETPISLSAERHAETGARIAVADHGDPIPAGERERIFDKFFRSGSELTREAEGVGIGLSLVRHIARAHGGRAFVEPTPAGNRFVIEIHANA